MDIFENVQHLCKKKDDMKISHLEKELGLGNGSIRRWNDSSPSADKLQKAADFFDVSTDFLIYGYDKEIIKSIENLAEPGSFMPQFSKKVKEILAYELDFLYKKYWDVAFDIDPVDLIRLLQSNNLSVEFKEDLLKGLNYAKQSLSKPALTTKEERDIARDLEKMLSDLESDSAMAFNGEPMDADDKEMLRISLENSMRLAKQMAKKKFTPNKYKK